MGSARWPHSSRGSGGPRLGKQRPVFVLLIGPQTSRGEDQRMSNTRGATVYRPPSSPRCHLCHQFGVWIGKRKRKKKQVELPASPQYGDGQTVSQRLNLYKSLSFMVLTQNWANFLMMKCSGEPHHRKIKYIIYVEKNVAFKQGCQTYAPWAISGPQKGFSYVTMKGFLPF